MADIWSFLTTAANWSGENGIATRIATHLWVSVLAVVVAIAIALPLPWPGRKNWSLGSTLGF